jgi:hypothetical protein
MSSFSRSKREGAMMNHKHSLNDWSQWLWWVLASAMGAAIALAAVPFVLRSIHSIVIVDEDRLFGILLAPMLGLFIGAMQWFVLRRHIPRAAWWVPASVAGYIAVLILAALSTNLGQAAIEGIADDVMLMSVLGTVVGVPQYLVLRKYFPKAQWWVLASAIGMLSYLLGGAIPAHNLIELVRLGVLSGAFSGAVTGIALVWLLQSAYGQSHLRKTLGDR